VNLKYLFLAIYLSMIQPFMSIIFVNLKPYNMVKWTNLGTYYTYTYSIFERISDVFCEKKFKKNRHIECEKANQI